MRFVHVQHTYNGPSTRAPWMNAFVVRSSYVYVQLWNDRWKRVHTDTVQMLAIHARIHTQTRTRTRTPPSYTLRHTITLPCAVVGPDQRTVTHSELFFFLLYFSTSCFCSENGVAVRLKVRLIVLLCVHKWREFVCFENNRQTLQYSVLRLWFGDIVEWKKRIW